MSNSLFTFVALSFLLVAPHPYQGKLQATWDDEYGDVIPSKEKYTTSHAKFDYLDPTDRFLPDHEKQSFHVEWGTPKRINYREDFGENYVEITGKLSILKEDGKTRVPLETQLPISVLIARVPGAKPSWGIRHLEADTFKYNTIINHLDHRRFVYENQYCSVGAFLVIVPLSKLRGQPNETSQYQIGLCLGTKTRMEVTWRDSDSVLAQTVQMIAIPKPHPNMKAFQLISACPVPYGGAGVNPVTLIRATNHLHSMGKENALVAIRQFLQEVPYKVSYTKETDRTKKLDTANPYCLASLLPLLFENPKQRKRIRIWQGIPFHTEVFIQVTGQVVQMGGYVELLAKNATFRDKPLRPTDDPFQAAERLYLLLSNKISAEAQGSDALLQKETWRHRDLQRHLRRQVWEMVDHLLPSELRAGASDPSDQHWNAAKKYLADRKLKWDEQQQKYILTVMP